MRDPQSYVDNHYPTDPAVLTTHGASIGALIATIVGWLPAFIALIPAVYYMFLIYETKTFQSWIRRRRLRRAAKRRAKHAHKHSG